MMRTNVTGLINMTQAVLPIFKRRPDGGAGDIINVGSIAGKYSKRSGRISRLTDRKNVNRSGTLRWGLHLLCDKGSGQEFLSQLEKGAYCDTG